MSSEAADISAAAPARFGVAAAATCGRALMRDTWLNLGHWVYVPRIAPASFAVEVARTAALIVAGNSHLAQTSSGQSPRGADDELLAERRCAPGHRPSSACINNVIGTVAEQIFADFAIWVKTITIKNDVDRWNALDLVPIFEIHGLLPRGDSRPAF